MHFVLFLPGIGLAPITLQQTRKERSFHCSDFFAPHLFLFPIPCRNCLLVGKMWLRGFWASSISLFSRFFNSHLIRAFRFVSSRFRSCANNFAANEKRALIPLLGLFRTTSFSISNSLRELPPCWKDVAARFLGEFHIAFMICTLYRAFRSIYIMYRESLISPSRSGS